MLAKKKVEILCALLTAIALVPVWLYPWFPTQDGPSHLYNAMLLADMGETTSAVFERVVAIFPNWSVYGLLALFGRIFTPFIALRIVISLCVVAIPASTLYLQKSFKPEADETALIGVMLAFNSLLFFGFLNFLLGCALFAFTVGARMRRRPVAALYLLLVLCYLTHGLAFSATLMALALIAILERRWKDLAVLAPAFAAAAIDVWPRLHSDRGYQSIAWHLQRLAALDVFAYFRAVHANIASAMSVVLSIAVVITLRRRRPWIAIALSSMLLAMFFISPWAYTAPRSQGLWLNERFLLLFVMTLPAWLARQRVLGAVLALLTVVHLVTTWRDVANISGNIAELTACRSAVADHATLDVVGQPPKIVTKLDPLRHAPAYLAAGRDIAYLPNYEAELEDFPIRFRGANRPRADFILVWRGARADGTVVCEGSGFRLLRAMDYSPRAH
ncbi:MAG TPA: hypothetical protein VN181_14535 [Thermoanaerobaculia bacterium]|nr:hypothetical protein [Thermoanaerobaculia bacterium]